MKQIPGFAGNYWITPQGEVWSRCSKLYRKQKNHKGYRSVTLEYAGERRHLLVHRLVALAYLANPLNRTTVNHKNGNKADNRIENLEWASHQENCIHAYKTGLMKVPPAPKGELHGRAKLTEQDVFDIRATGLLKTAEELAKEFGVNAGTIQKIRQRARWTHI